MYDNIKLLTVAPVLETPAQLALWLVLVRIGQLEGESPAVERLESRGGLLQMVVRMQLTHCKGRCNQSRESR